MDNGTTMDDKKSEALRGRIKEIKGHYPTHQGAVLPSLYAAQEVYGWLSEEAMREVSAHTAVPAAEVKGVATFYAMYKTRPMGRHIIQLCTNISCIGACGTAPAMLVDSTAYDSLTTEKMLAILQEYR